MSSERLCSLRLQKQALADSLAEAKKEPRARRRQEANAQRRLQAEWSLAPDGDDGMVSTQSLPDISKAALILYDRAGYQAEAAAAFLARAAAKRGWKPRQEEVVVALVRELFLKVALPEYVALCDVESPSDVVAMGQALRFWEEWALVAWAKDANVRLGVAPSTEAVLERAEKLRQDLPADWRPASKGSAASVKARAWRCRWRRRWGGRIGVVRPKDDIDPQEIREKATLSNYANAVFAGC